MSKNGEIRAKNYKEEFENEYEKYVQECKMTIDSSSCQDHHLLVKVNL